MRKIVYFLTVTFLSISCLSKLNEKLLFGEYQFNTNKLDVIYVFKDHTYSHKYTNSKGKIFQVNGKWTFSGKEIAFYNFSFFSDLGTMGGEGIWISEVTEDNGIIKFIYSDDDDTCFEKIN